MMRPGNMGLRGRLIALLLATLIPLVGLGAYGVIREVRTERARVERESREAAARIAAQVADLVGNLQGMLSALAHVPAVQRQDGAEAERLFREILGGWPELENIAAFTREGKLFAAASPGTSGAPILVDDRAWFQAVVRTGQPVAGGFVIGRIKGKAVAILARPVLDGHGRLLGVISAALELSAISRGVAPVQLGVPSVWAVVDGEGLALLHGEAGDRIGKPLTLLPGMLRAESPVGRTEWRAIVGVPRAVVDASVRDSLLKVALPALLIFLAAVILGFWIARNTWRPLQQLATAARRISAGDRNIRLPVGGEDEVGEVAAAFQGALDVVTAREDVLADLNKELATLVEASRAVATSLDLEKSLQAIVQQATTISGTNFVRLLLVDEEARVLRYRVGVGLPLQDEQNIVVPIGESFSGQVAATGNPLAVADTREDPRLRYPQRTTKYGLVSYLGLPVKLGDRVLGVLVFDTQSSRTYSKAEITYLSAFAAQAAIAIENARLYDAARRDLAERTQAEEALAVRTRHLEAIRSISEEITRELDLKAVLDLIIHRAVALVGATSGSIRLWNQEQQLLIPEAQAGSGTHSAGVPLRLGEGVAGAAAEQRRGLIVNDFRTSAYTIPALLKGTTHTAVMATPLRYGERLVGAVGITRDETGPPFSEADLEVLNLFAPQAAIAIENARLFRQAQGRQQQVEAVGAVSEEITRELDLTTLLELIIQRSRELVGAAAGSIYLWDETGGVLIPRAWHGLGEWMRDVRLRPGEAVAGTVAQRRDGMRVNDFPASPYTFPLFRERAGTTAVLAEPLLYRDRLVGVITLTHDQPGRQFTEEHQNLLRLLAAQAAIAIENARLHDATVQWMRQLTTLNAVARALAAELDPQRVAQQILQAVETLLPGAAARLWEFVEDKKAVRLVASIGLREAEGDLHMPIGRDNLSGMAFATQQPVITRDLQREPRYLNRAWAASEGLVSCIVMPLVRAGCYLGDLKVFTRIPHDFTQVEIDALRLFADQAVIAIENARLYDKVLRHAAELESRVRARTAELEEALRVKTEFLGKMSHELRTPLNFVLGFSDLLQQGMGGPLTPKQATYVDRVQSGGRRLLSLVNDVLDIAQVDAGKSRLNLEPVILGSLVQEVLGLLEIRAAQKRLKVTTALDPWLPFVVADRFKLAQILHNLIGNAVKFTPDGGSITVTARQVPGSEGTGAGEQGSGGAVEVSPQPPGATAPQQFVEISVEDTGIGIRPEELEAIFAAFHQVDGSDTRAYEGAGLGLTLVRMLVELHGGRVWAESAGPGQGARFVVRLPCLEVPKAKRILLVEDEALIRIPMASALESAGFAVEQAATGAEALAAMEVRTLDLLILDILLPDLDGWEILRRVREAEDIRTLPVLVVTGLESVNAEQAIARGADEFLTKPVSPRVLVDTVVRLLGHVASGSPVMGRRAGKAEEQPGNVRKE